MLYTFQCEFLNLSEGLNWPNSLSSHAVLVINTINLQCHLNLSEGPCAPGLLYCMSGTGINAFENTDSVTPKLQFLLVSIKTHQATIPYSQQLRLLS